MSDSIIVRVVGVGSSVEVEIPQDANVEDVLAKAGIDPEAAGLNVSRNGAPVDPSAPVADGDAISTTPREAKLG